MLYQALRFIHIMRQWVQRDTGTKECQSLLHEVKRIVLVERTHQEEELVHRPGPVCVLGLKNNCIRSIRGQVQVSLRHSPPDEKETMTTKAAHSFGFGRDPVPARKAAEETARQKSDPSYWKADLDLQAILTPTRPLDGPPLEVGLLRSFQGRAAAAAAATPPTTTKSTPVVDTTELMTLHHEEVAAAATAAKQSSSSNSSNSSSSGEESDEDVPMIDGDDDDDDDDDESFHAMDIDSEPVPAPAAPQPLPTVSTEMLQRVQARLEGKSKAAATKPKAPGPITMKSVLAQYDQGWANALDDANDVKFLQAMQTVTTGSIRAALGDTVVANATEHFRTTFEKPTGSSSARKQATPLFEAYETLWAFQVDPALNEALCPM